MLEQADDEDPCILAFEARISRGGAVLWTSIVIKASRNLKYGHGCASAVAVLDLPLTLTTHAIWTLLIVKQPAFLTGEPSQLFS